MICDCEKSKEKIILIEIDVLGNVFCGYCKNKIKLNKLIEVGFVK